MKKLLTFFMAFVAIGFIFSCSDDNDYSGQKYAKPESIQNGVWTNCIDYTDSTTSGIIMKVDGPSVEFSLFDLEKGNLAYSSGKMTYDKETGRGTIDVPASITDCGLLRFAMLSDNIMECIPEKYPDDTIHFLYIAESTEDWWGEEEPDCDKLDGSVGGYDFSTDLLLDIDMPSNAKYTRADGWDIISKANTIIGVVSGIGKIVTGIIGLVKGKNKDKAAEETRKNVNSTLEICKGMDKNIVNLQNQMTEMNKNLNNHLNMMEKNIKDELKRLDEKINLTTAEIMEKQRLMLYQQSVTQQKLDLMETSEKLNARNEEATRLHLRALGYKDSVATIINTETDNISNKLYDYLNKWAAAETSGENYVQRTIAFTRRLYSTLCDNKSGYPYIYDQYVFNTKAWEHEGYNNRANLRLADLTVVYESVLLSALYLEACISTGNTVYGAKPEPLLEELEMECQNFSKCYDESKIEIREDKRVCQIVGAHFVADSRLMEIGKIPDLYRGVDMNNPSIANVLAYSFPTLGGKSVSQEERMIDPGVAMKQTLTPLEAACIIDYYGGTLSMKQILDNAQFKEEASSSSPNKSSASYHCVYLNGNAFTIKDYSDYHLYLGATAVGDMNGKHVDIVHGKKASNQESFDNKNYMGYVQTSSGGFHGYVKNWHNRLWWFRIYDRY